MMALMNASSSPLWPLWPSSSLRRCAGSSNSSMSSWSSEAAWLRGVRGLTLSKRLPVLPHLCKPARPKSRPLGAPMLRRLAAHPSSANWSAASGKRAASWKRGVPMVSAGGARNGAVAAGKESVRGRFAGGDAGAEARCLDCLARLDPGLSLGLSLALSAPGDRAGAAKKGALPMRASPMPKPAGRRFGFGGMAVLTEMRRSTSRCAVSSSEASSGVAHVVCESRMAQNQSRRPSTAASCAPRMRHLWHASHCAQDRMSTVGCGGGGGATAAALCFEPHSVGRSLFTAFFGGPFCRGFFGGFFGGASFGSGRFAAGASAAPGGMGRCGVSQSVEPPTMKHSHPRSASTSLPRGMPRHLEQLSHWTQRSGARSFAGELRGPTKTAALGALDRPFNLGGAALGGWATLGGATLGEVTFGAAFLGLASGLGLAFGASCFFALEFALDVAQEFAFAIRAPRPAACDTVAAAGLARRQRSARGMKSTNPSK
mmetsp:Transcript_32276/g.111071  ORF Transcript_32276/g.111071 Transcript_32276/m.111071 type:complete len:486 (-) Transcript_32276:488-1945(-)